jgi:signal transduction histidine kinase
VGREVSLQPLIDFQSEMVQRVLAIIAGLVILLLFSTRLVARRVEKLSNELIGGIRQTLESRKAVKFDWNDTKELRELSSDLTKLSTLHAEQAEAQKAHTKELEASNKYKSEFLANVSHELRTPLNSILLLSKLLAAEDAQLKDKQKQQAGVIHKAANDLKNLIDNILDLSKIEARKFDVHCEQIDVQQLVDDLHEMLEPQYQAKQLTFKVEHQQGAPRMIRSDADKLRQILKNFLANALKFTDQGQVTLRVAPAEKPYAVMFSVIDSGIGIAPEKQKKIFDAFQQADGSTNRKYGGTGLGLTISRQLARLMQGDIQLSSQVDEGATFSILLPLSCDSGEIIESVKLQVDDAKDVEPIEEVVQADLSSKRLLVIEPSIARQLRISKAINACQGKVLFIDDLDEAEDVLKEEGAIDALLIDQDAVLDNVNERLQSLRKTQETPFRLMIIKSTSNPSENTLWSAVSFDANVLLSDDMKSFTQQVRDNLE